MVFVVLSGVPLNVDPADLAEKINIYFGENEEIGTFRVNIDDSDIHKPKAVLKFIQGFDAMEAQRLLHNFKYVDSDSMIYNIKAVVSSDEQQYQSLFREEIPDVADAIKSTKRKRRNRKRQKKRKHSTGDNILPAKDSNLLKTDLEIIDIEKLEMICNNLKKKAEKYSSQSDRSASESECKKRDKSIYGESSGVSKRQKSSEDVVSKKKFRKEDSKQRIVVCSKMATPFSTRESRERSRSTTNDLCLPSQRVPVCVESPKKLPKNYKIPHLSDTSSSKSFDSRKVNVCQKKNEKLSENQSSDERIPQNSSEHIDPKPDIRDDSRLSSIERPIDDLRHKVEARRLMRESKASEYASYFDYEAKRESHVSSLRGQGTMHTELSSRYPSNECTFTEYTVLERRRGTKLLLLDPSHYLTENDPEFKEAVEHIIDTVMTDTDRLQEEDKKLILENYTTTVVKRLKSLKFTNLMSIQDIVLDYKLSYKTSDDKLLINNLVKELQALGKGILLPEIKQERLGEAIDEVLKTTDLDEFMEDVKPDIKQEIKSEKTLEYEYEDGGTTEVINIVVNLVPIEKRELPLETDPEKVADIKVFVSKLKKTKPNKFYRPIRSILNEMKLFIYNNAKTISSEVILNRMVEVLEKILARMMGPIKTRVKAKDVCNLFRNSFPYKEDREFVDMIIKWIVDGEFDKGAIDGLINEKIPNIEKNIKTIDEYNKSTVKQCLPSVKVEPLSTGGIANANPTLLSQIKIENTDIQFVNQSETATTNTLRIEEQIAKGVRIKTEKHDNIEIKKETFDIISIDDDLDIKKEVDDQYMTSQVNIETIIISDSDEDAQSDDSRTTQVIESKPYLHNDLVFGVNLNRDLPVPNTSLKSGQPDDMGEPGEILDDHDILGEPGEILDEPGEILDDPGDIMGDLGETIDDIRQYLKRGKN